MCRYRVKMDGTSPKPLVEAIAETTSDPRLRHAIEVTLDEFESDDAIPEYLAVAAVLFLASQSDTTPREILDRLFMTALTRTEWERFLTAA